MQSTSQPSGVMTRPLDVAAPAEHSGAARPWAKRISDLANGWTLARQWIEFAGFRVVAAIAAAIPLETASGLSGWFWRQIAPHLRRHRRALESLAIAYPEKSLAERERIAVEMWENLGRTFAEFFHLKRITAENRLTLQAPERFEAIAKGGPFIVCGLHMGNWELLSQPALRLGIPLAGVYQALTNPLVDKWLLKQRAPLYPGGLFDKSPSTARALLRLARDGGSPAFLADLRAGNGAIAPFFGRPAKSNPFPALIARTLGRPLFAARVLRKAGVRFEMRIEPVDVPVSDDRDADVRAATANIQARLEEFVREAPEQWMWTHRRWD